MIIARTKPAFTHPAVHVDKPGSMNEQSSTQHHV